MKTKAIIILLIFLNFGCSSGSKIFSTGEVVIKNDIEVLDIKIINDLPLCRVSIQGNEYNFLVDTGAPMVISDELFAKLQNYKKLLDNGLILQGEYDNFKKEILGYM